MRAPPPVVDLDARAAAASPGSGHDAAPRPTARPLKFALALLLGAGLLAWLVRHADFAPLMQAARALPPAAWAIAAVGLLGTYGLRALRLQAEWRHVRLAPFTQCLRLVLSHNAALLLLPMRAGEAGYLWLVRRLWGVPLTEAACSLLWLRLQDACMLALLALALLLPAPAWLRALLCIGALLVGVLMVPALLRALRRRIPRLDRLADAVLTHRSDATGWLYCAANWLLKIAVVGALLSALGQVGLLGGIHGALGGELAGALPLQGPAGLGTYEAGVWAAGGQTRPLIAAALAVHAFSLAVALLGAAAAQGLWREHRPPTDTIHPQ